MRNHLLILGIFTVILQSCNKDEALLTPSFADEDRAVVYADRSYPVADRLLTDFNSGLLYEYDANMDFRYTAEAISQTSKWNGIKIPTIKEDRFTNSDGTPVESFEYVLNFPDRSITISSYEEHVEAALSFLDTTLFTYFQSDSKIATLFPKKILVSSKITSTADTGVDALTESDSRVSSNTAQKALRSVYNRNSIVLSGSMKDIAPEYEKFKKDNFYVFLIRIMDQYNLYDEFPDELFVEKEKYYRDTIGAVYGAVAPYRTSPIIPHDWYHGLGFIDTHYLTKLEMRYRYSSGSWVDPSIVNSFGFGSRRRIYPKHMFPADRKEDIKSFLNELIHRTAADGDYYVGFDNLPEVLRGHLKAMADIYISWGIDLKAFNPDIESLYN